MEEKILLIFSLIVRVVLHDATFRRLSKLSDFHLFIFIGFVSLNCGVSCPTVSGVYFSR